jgi:hypothetical protein
MKTPPQAQKNIQRSSRSGQAMLIAVLSLGGAILGATTVAGLLTLYQIRATTDSANSAKAIFAADSGVEWALFNHSCDATSRCPGYGSSTGRDYPAPSFVPAGGVIPSLSVSCYVSKDASDATTTCSNASTTAAISSGIANGSERAFFLNLAGAPTLP